MKPQQPTLKKGLSTAAIIALVLISIAIVTLGMFGMLYGLKKAFKSGTSSFQFSVDVASVHSDLNEYYLTHNKQYPPDAYGQKFGGFYYHAAPTGCDNVTTACNGYSVTHKSYNKTETNLDYKLRQMKKAEQQNN